MGRVKPSPRDFDLPHDEWRPHQYESVEYLLKSRYEINILEGQTGSGKSSIVKALGAQERSVTALTMTHMLQQQYVDLYDFTELKGSRNYDCEYNPMFQANMCQFLPRRYDCPVSDLCSYLIQRKAYQEAQFRSLNYDYFALAGWLREKQTHWLACDEAHRIPAWLSDHLSISMSRADCTDLRIPQYPNFKVTSNPVRLRFVVKWLESAIVVLEKEINRLEGLAQHNPRLMAKLTSLTSRKNQFASASIGISESPEDWYCLWDENQIRVTPLDVSKYFHPIFLDGFEHQILLTSATIGNPDTFADVLGIKAYSYKSVPSNWTPEQRRVWVWEDAPAMGYRSTPLEKAKQADIIASAIKGLPSDWAGVIHVQSKAKAREVGDRLARRGLQDRLYQPKGMTTADKLHDIKQAKERYGNPIVVDYSIGEGADLGEFKINIQADIPFPYLGDEIGRTRMERNKAYYGWETGIGIVQRAGRTRRGRPEDYGEENGFVGIADNAYTYVLSQLSEDFVSTIAVYK